jgi:hypothetical protein
VQRFVLLYNQLLFVFYVAIMDVMYGVRVHMIKHIQLASAKRTW